jgi:Family of unknown function (DUF6228)
MRQIEFKSSAHGSTLIFDVTERTSDEISFNVSVKTPWFSGVAPASTIHGSPAQLFLEMAAERNGWTQKKTWADLEQRVSFEATCDLTGHVTLIVTLVGQDYESQLRAIIKYDLGQLEKMSSDLSLLLG